MGTRRIFAGGQGTVQVAFARHIESATEYFYVNRIYEPIINLS